jgi:hypothetical protein
MSLGELIDKHHCNFVPGLWNATVSGLLPFAQDLIFSKQTTIKQIRSAVLGKALAEVGDLSSIEQVEQELSQLPGIFALARRNIENGIITHDIWELLLKVCTNSELKAIRALKVESAIYYDKRLESKSVDEWCKTVFRSECEIDSGHDGRCRNWCRVPIGGFMGPLLEERTRIKKLCTTQLKQENYELYCELNAKQTLFKLFINTLYGVLASPYFEISNVVVANCITAKARLGTWMMNKALGTWESITDGGAYQLSTVRFLSKSARLPGLSALADNGNWLDYKHGRTEGNLGALNWNGDYWTEFTSMVDANAGRLLDKLASEHINNFWGRYDLVFPYNINHKAENTFEQFASWNKTDYAFRRVAFKGTEIKPTFYTDADGHEWDVSGVKIKARGEHFDLSKPDTVAPKIEILIHVLNGSDDFPTKRTWLQHHILRCGEAKRAEQNGLIPGDSLVQRRGESGRPLIRRHNQHFDTVKEYRAAEKARYGGFEEFAAEGISGVHKRIVSGSRRPKR